jgi:hypothetical protein
MGGFLRSARTSECRSHGEGTEVAWLGAEKLKTMFKADIFIFKRDSWSREEMRRARTIDLGEPISLEFASPEDTLLHKLIWYKLGNEISDR